MRVKATQLGFYEYERRNPGVEFDLLDASHISLRWMAPADKEAEEAFKSAAAKLKADGKDKAWPPKAEQPQETLAKKAAKGGLGKPPSHASVI